MKGYVYILRDKKEKLYIGSTNDIQRRLSAHLSGHTQTARNMDKPKLVLVQEYETLAEVRQIERKIKKLKRKDYVKMMIEEGCIRLKT